jgi:hypothetical protein
MQTKNLGIKKVQNFENKETLVLGLFFITLYFFNLIIILK